MSKPIQHSYSSTGAFNTCPIQYKSINYLRTFRSESNEAAERGTLMHEEYEECVNEDTDYSMPAYQWLLDDFRAETGLKIAEMKLAIDRNWQPVDYKDPTAWYRGMIDFTIINGTHADVRDAKTGKRKFKEAPGFERWLLDRHEEGMKEAPKILANARQASEYALLSFLHLPEVKTMDFRFIWTDVPGVREDVFHFDRERDGQKLLQTMLTTPVKIQHAVDNDEWEANPSGLCRLWCPVINCEYHGRSMSQINKMRSK